MDEQLRNKALTRSRFALDLLEKETLTSAEQEAVIGDCVRNFELYVNPGILEYRKSASTDYTAVEWTDGGATFRDIHGREFIDCLGGFGMFTLGHRHPTVMRAVMRQFARQALHSQEMLDPMRSYLGELLALVTPGDLQYSFFCNSGTEATEGALKFAKLHAWSKKPDHNKGVISTTKAFHGKSIGSLSISGKSEFREPFYPLVPGARFIPYGDADALERELKICDMIGFDIAAFVVEPVQGEAGAIVPPDDYFPKVREICDKWHVLFLCDEVQTGMGRCGTFWGIDRWGVVPDILYTAKAFGGGVMPAAAITVKAELYEKMFENPYLHSTTFGGNPPACAAAIAAIHVTLEEDIPAQADEKGSYLKGRIQELAAEYDDLYEDVRGLGVLIGMEFRSTEIGYAVTKGLFGAGVLVAGTLNNAKTFRLEPPATISYDQIEEVVSRLGSVLEEVRADVKAGALTPAH